MPHHDESHRDPRKRYPVPDFPRQQQETPGEEDALRPHADHGEQSYVGHGRLSGRVALVTGGDSGIGRAVCLAFAREGADIACAYLGDAPGVDEQGDAEETRRIVEEAGREVLLIPGDLGDAAFCRDVVARTVARFGRIDVLVNNAGFQGRAVDGIAELDEARIEHTFRVNILAMFHLVKAALPHLAPGSTIVNTTSIQSYDPSPAIMDYAATKGAITNFTKALARDLVSRGIRVNAVAPGPIWTPLIPQSFDPGKVSSFGKDTPMGRPGQPVEVAPAFVFLASDDSTYITGEVIGVTGGRLLS